MKKALVTGALGFIGSHLVDRLLSDGWEVTAVDNLLTGKRENLGHHAQNGKLHVVVANTKQLDVTYFKDIDVVFNLAAIARTPWTIADPMLSHQMTTTNTLHALLMAKKAGVKRFVHSSSCIVYVPNTPYYVAKQAAEEYVRIFQSLYGLSTVSLRYSNVYGMRQSEEGISPNVFAALRKSKKESGRIYLTGDGEQTRDYTHVSDIVEANMLAAESEQVGAYYVGTGIATSLNDVAPYFNCIVEYVDERQGDIKHLVRDASEFQRMFGWQPKMALADGIVDVL
jgi:UDP-glucose 4-epimerase